ncbi:MBL fold metallo-hydrolase [Reinekea marinisedimentorum]|uniref:hydroxyacylglutathione hydrolase n=1 Tax=Reinekea marinisedimentorum TaxID=230495 RepID=A0A4R3ICT7_9GAMM|nr:MBL fold metallo-hydrolase [Reinekea marinisedimentorum]TCS42435.1 hydroxyacylglutathione hydrolase [Reinekea marinisedimentorum]
MDVIRTFVPGSFANYNHLVYSEQTGEAAAVDPFDAAFLVDVAERNNLKITQIWITHEHGDHIKDVAKLKAATQAPVYAPVTCKGKVDADHWLEDEQQLFIGQQAITHLLTPGHIAGHGVYLYLNKQAPESDFIIAGDTLFNAGVGNIKSGNVDELYDSIEKLHKWLTPGCRIYTGHDYIETNLKFTLHYCPQLEEAKTTLLNVAKQTPDSRSVQTWHQEMAYNLFLRLDSEEVCSMTKCAPNRKARFTELRHLRDQW